MEVAFQAKTMIHEDGTVLLDDSYFMERVEQYKEVYKSPQLELVGWFAVGPLSGPQSHHVPVHAQLQQQGYESACLLLFHPNAPMTGGKLPLSIYEGVVAGEGAMDTDESAPLKFRKLNYAVETGEAEMISVDSVAKGSGNATAIPVTADTSASTTKGTDKTKGKGKGKDSSSDEVLTNGTSDETYLSPEDDELITTLTAKSNAIKMLTARISLIRSYLSSLPPSYLTDAALPPTADTKLDHQILRSILALQARIPLLVPPDRQAFEKETLEQKSDTALVQLLSSITSSVHETGEMNRKNGIVESARALKAGGRRLGLDGPPEYSSMGMELGGSTYLDPTSREY